MITTIQPGVRYSFSLKNKKQVALLDSFLKALDITLREDKTEENYQLSQEAYYELMKKSMESLHSSKELKGEKAILEHLNTLK
ncbi:hypothetical protein HMPREF1551_02589 [Capnocytophaga sp. oral taxon 863 str. F0517]|uniref:hypothetical protein n=1 Tax=Capnocytophaga sp. oral taxon 863 TaxID=1227265 RepID=UPI00039868D1|nr:hypothetical protein [Capnocytophaga sp. oral taxon 863]ERI61578.1 hypothetical protein HMPREF1551_02589 [Capnocytophaga sp. oral taxon 863 str. F0517]